VGATLLYLPLPQFFSPFAQLIYELGWMSFIPGYAFTAIIIPIGAVVFLFVKRKRRLVPLLACMSLVAWCALPLSFAVEPPRNWGLRNAIASAQPLIAAIEMYKSEYGIPPARLQSLIPRHIEAIPYTRMAGYPEFEYSVVAQEDIFKEYELLVSTSTGGLNWDVFVYWPEQQYPSEMYGGWVERIDGWAYVHE
jgi:hypothetical protein